MLNIESSLAILLSVFRFHSSVTKSNELCNVLLDPESPLLERGVLLLDNITYNANFNPVSGFQTPYPYLFELHLHFDKKPHHHPVPDKIL